MFPIKSNFSSLHKNNLFCSLCKEASSTENEEHLLECPFLRNNAILREDIKCVKFEDIFRNEQKQGKVAKVFKQILDIYERNKKIVC